MIVMTSGTRCKRAVINEIVDELIEKEDGGLMAFRSGLEEKVADLMVELGVKYEYEVSRRFDYEIMKKRLHIQYTPDFRKSCQTESI